MMKRLITAAPKLIYISRTQLFTAERLAGIVDDAQPRMEL